MRSRATAVLGVLAGLLVAAAPAGAHIQVTPSKAAPGDPVLFEVLVPGESGEETTEIELAVPDGVLPFSFGETPGWKRTITNNDNGSIKVVSWRGRLAPDGFARFGFLASTPPEEGSIEWDAIQTYSDGQKARWIGAPGSDDPAPVTEISEATPRQNAGGEGEQAAPPAATPDQPPAGPSAGRGTDMVPLVLSLAALAIAVAALITARRRTAR